MAIGDNNTVPLGQAGTGGAFILGDSQSANQFVANQARNQAIAYQNELAKQKEAMANAKLYQDNQLKLKGGLLWQNDINALAQQDLNQGSQLMASGINPYRLNYNDPTQVQKGTEFLMNREAIKAKNDQRLGLIQEAQKVQSNISENPDMYEPEDILRFNQWQSGSLDDAINNPIPQVRPKFQPNKDLVPLLDPITFQTSKVVGNTKIAENKVLEEPTKTNIEALIGGNEAGNRWIKRETGLTPSEAKNIPSTFEANKKDLLKQYKGDPSLRESLAKQYGITGEGQALDDLLNQQAQQNTLAKQKYNSVIDQYLNVAKGKANEFLKTNPDFTIRNHQMAEDRLNLARQKEARIASGGADNAAIYRQNQIDDIWSERNSASGAGNAVERLRAVVEANPLFKGANTSTMIRDTGRWINISVPERRVAYTTTDPEGNEILRYRKQDAYKVTIDKSNPDDKLKLNKVYDALTGEKISDSKLQTGNAGGKIKSGIYSEQQSVPKSVTSKFKSVPKGGF